MSQKKEVSSEVAVIDANETGVIDITAMNNKPEQARRAFLALAHEVRDIAGAGQLIQLTAEYFDCDQDREGGPVVEKNKMYLIRMEFMDQMESTMEGTEGEMIDTVNFTDLETGKKWVSAASMLVGAAKQAFKATSGDVSDNMKKPHIILCYLGKKKGKSGFKYDNFTINMLPPANVEKVYAKIAEINEQ